MRFVIIIFALLLTSTLGFQGSLVKSPVLSLRCSLIMKESSKKKQDIIPPPLYLCAKNVVLTDDLKDKVTGKIGKVVKLFGRDVLKLNVALRLRKLSTPIGDNILDTICSYNLKHFLYI